jgi:C_GCAxxG_C_C family probable redox protein
MTQLDHLKAKVEELSEKDWDVSAIKARIEMMLKEGILRKKLNAEELKKKKQEIQERVSQRAEEYNFYLKNCAQGTALSLLEEFGLGNMEIIKALTTFPGIGGTGEICGGITGSLIAFSLYFAGDELPDLPATGIAMEYSQRLYAQFIAAIGYPTCAEIQENVIFDRNMDPGASEQNMEAFAKAKGFEKCGLPPGIGARLAAGYIIDSMK